MLLQLHPYGFAALALDLGVPGRQKPLLRNLLYHTALATALGPSRDDKAVSPPLLQVLTSGPDVFFTA